MQFHNFHPKQDDILQEVINGLKQTPKTLSPKFFYDQRGAILFELICLTPEYYPTNTEKEILETYAQEIAAEIGENAVIIEPGSGDCKKAQILFPILKPKAFVPIDIASYQLQQVSQFLEKQYENIDIYAVCSDINVKQDWQHIADISPKNNRVLFYPGSSIGNFEPEQAINLLNNMHNIADTEGGLLIGVDMQKPLDILKKAYDDALGITAAFNKNLLLRLNEELQANFNLYQFKHFIQYNSQENRIEMHLKSLKNQTIVINNQDFIFQENETIHTENSYKYTVDSFIALAEKAQWKFKSVWQDEKKYFSVFYFKS